MAMTIEPTTRFAPGQTLNEIVAVEPRALPVLQAFGLDTCCGGSLPLQVAAQHHRRDLAEVLAALHEALNRR
jgi:iron-sulfur cluster repair protein YtfE (RIC family)